MEPKGYEQWYGNWTYVLVATVKSFPLKKYRFLYVPEIGLSFLSFFLNFFWEVAQTYFYTFKDSPFDTMLYGWLHCAWVDVMIILGCFWLVCLVSRNRRWFLRLNKVNFACFVMAGVVYTTFSEWANVQVFGSWSYNEAMPTIPPIGVGLTPILQWIVIPSITILLMRHYLSLAQVAVETRSSGKDTDGLKTP